MTSRLFKRAIPFLALFAAVGVTAALLPAEESETRAAKSCPAAKACPAGGEKACCGTCGGDKQACPAGNKAHKTCPMHGKKHAHGHGMGQPVHRAAAAMQIRHGLNQIEAAHKAMENDRPDEARKALGTAQEHLSKAHAMVRPPVANKRCPMMGNPVDPQAVPASLYRQHGGKGVGFCCGGCVPAWEKLSDEEKTAKLQSSMTSTQ